MPLIPKVRSSLLLLGAVAATAGLAGCEMLVSKESLTNIVRPYSAEVVQGNVLTKELIARVQIGMPRAQVRDLLGSPLLTDVFHGDRWDYVFTIRRRGTEPQRRSVVLMFDGDRLISVDTGGELPAEEAFVASIDSASPDGRTPTLALSADELQSLKPPPKPAVVEPPTVPPGRVYPPLEPPR
jgi:outer membrane protein assembly factor BamE